jgi:hypothetical protein
MDNIFVESTEKTPLIDFNHITGDLILSGRSIPENAARIYEPLIAWTIDYINNPRALTNFRLNLEYFNTSSSLWITKLIKTLCRIKTPESVLLIHMYFNVEDYNNIEDIKDDIIQLTSVVVENEGLSVGYKIYGTDDDGSIVKESMVFI